MCSPSACLFWKLPLCSAPVWPVSIFLFPLRPLVAVTMYNPRAFLSAARCRSCLCVWGDMLTCVMVPPLSPCPILFGPLTLWGDVNGKQTIWDCPKLAPVPVLLDFNKEVKRKRTNRPYSLMLMRIIVCLWEEFKPRPLLTQECSYFQ